MAKPVSTAASAPGSTIAPTPEPTITAAPTQATGHQITTDGRGVILKSASDRLLVWQPSQAQVVRLEAGLRLMLAELEHDPLTSHAPILAHVAAYTRQHRGLAYEGREVIGSSYFCDVAVDDLLRGWYDVLDGGDCYFYTTYDPAAGEFLSLVVNGEA